MVTYLGGTYEIIYLCKINDWRIEKTFPIAITLANPHHQRCGLVGKSCTEELKFFFNSIMVAIVLWHCMESGIKN